jgi:GT2 family glycosyltransferase/glycosyltransferase involved in cell wall biosynthesis
MGAVPGATVNVTAPVTVVVPVYGGAADLERCVESVLRHGDGGGVAFELRVIDDASPEDDVRAYLARVASQSTAVPIGVAHNHQNLGFVGTVNRGLREARGDVVVLNSDTVVTAGWLDRLAQAASLADVATVTPLTNSGSICTVPITIIDAFDLEGLEPRIDDCAAFVAEHSLRRLPEVITGVGFCMYVTRRARDLCGLLDEETFGRGYGEEVDFCLRATRMGLRHLVEDSTFVYHRGGASFGDQREEGLARSSAILDDRYHFFRPANTRERADDPLRVSFAALELGVDDRRPDRPHVLQLLHSPPGEVGGTEKHLRSLMHVLHEEIDFSVLYPVESGFGLRTYWNTGANAPIEHEFLLPGGPRQVTAVHDEVAVAALGTALDMFDFDAVHIHNLIGHSLAPLDVLADFAGPVVCSVHDLYLACPNFSLLYQREEPCGIPEDLSFCERCLATVAASPMPGSPKIAGLSLAYLQDFRSTVEARVGTVDHWVFASRSAADYLLRAYDLDPERVEIIEHGATIRLRRDGDRLGEARIFDEPLRLAFVGMGWAKKGLAVVNELAEAFAASTVELHHFGELKQRASPELHVHGPYHNSLIPELLHRSGIQVVLLPGPYAETFGYVMTEALVAGLPVIGARYGALGERIRAHGAGWTIDPMDLSGIRTLIERLDRCRSEVLLATRGARAVQHHLIGETADRYAALYGSMTERLTSAIPQGTRTS